MKDLFAQTSTSYELSQGRRGKVSAMNSKQVKNMCDVALHPLVYLGYILWGLGVAYGMRPNLVKKTSSLHGAILVE